MHDAFVDHVLTGVYSDKNSLVRQNQVISLSAQGKFQFRKGASNSPAILQSVPAGDCSISTNVLFDDELTAGLKIFGMQWNLKQDYFFYTFQSRSMKQTKLFILANIVRIFDPLGFLTPITFLAKHMMQLLWISGIG